MQGKRDELTKLKSEQTELNLKVKTLEGELTKLDPKKAEEARVKDVTVAPLTSSTFKHFVELQGTIDAKNNVQVSPKSGGVLRRYT